MRADALQRRRRLLAAARRLFAEHGGGVSLDLVAQAAGVGIATLYRNFPDREALTTAVMLDLVEDLERAVADAAATPDEDPHHCWGRLVRRLVALEVAALTDALGGGHLPDQVTRAQARALDGLGAALRPLIDGGVVRPDLDALELVAAAGILGRPQPEAVRAAAPQTVDHLVDAFLAWSRQPAAPDAP